VRYRETPPGEFWVLAADKGQTIECTVSDTGAGISEADLPRVFGKFQQFGRSTATSGEKGTGLGLAICKGIVEAHQGRIWVESKFGAGTKFIFSLPKFSAKELFRDSIVKGLDEAMREETNLSIVVFNIENYDSLEQRMGRQQTATLVRGLEGAARGHLRRKFDVAVRDTRAILVLLPATGREEALMTAGRIQQTFDDYLSEEGLQNEIRFHCKVATFPEDGNTEDELLNKVWGG